MVIDAVGADQEAYAPSLSTASSEIVAERIDGRQPAYVARQARPDIIDALERALSMPSLAAIHVVVEHLETRRR